MTRKESQKKYYESNKKKAIAASMRWNQNNKDKINAAAKRWYENNKEKLKEKNRLKTKEWARNNPDKVLYQSSLKRANKNHRTPKWLCEKDFNEMKKIYSAAKRRSDIEGRKYHVDHIIPLKGKNVSGLHIPSNLQIILATENMSKSNKF